MKTFANRFGPWAVVTGASSGIGRALAEQVAKRGLNVVLVARRESQLQELAKSLKSNQMVEARVVAADLATAAGLERVFQETRELDVGLFVGAAGFGTSGKFLELEIQTELEMLDLNCRALLAQTHHFGRRFLERGRGGIVLLSSIVGLQGIPNAAHYGATKAYVQVLAEGLYYELKPQGVDVLAAAPGPTQSGFADRAGMQMGKAMDPAKIAPQILDALGRRSTVLPGFLSKLLVYSQASLPRSMRVRIMGKVMEGMTSHQKAARS